MKYTIPMLLSMCLFNNNLRSDETTQQLVEYGTENGYNDCNFFTNGENYCLSKHLNKSSQIIFDVGANVGDWTLMALSNAPKAKIHAFEPQPEIFEILTKKTTTANVECLPFGLSNFTGVANFWVWGDHADIEKSGLNGLHYRQILVDNFNQNPISIEVPLSTLDDYCEKNEIEHIDYLKIDTEGNELFVLLGAKKMISNRHIKVIQFEYGGCYLDSQTRLESVYTLLKENGFAISRILPIDLEAIPAWDPELENFQYSNYIAILEDAAS
jgi:FkbM family methyltransferase